MTNYQKTLDDISDSHPNTNKIIIKYYMNQVKKEKKFIGAWFHNQYGTNYYIAINDDKVLEIVSSMIIKKI